MDGVNVEARIESGGILATLDLRETFPGILHCKLCLYHGMME